MSDSLTLYHGAHTRFALHVGQCFAPDERSAESYADGSGIVAEIDLSLDGLDVWEVDGYDWDTDTAPGDSLDSLAEYGLPIDGSVDVIIYDDADQYGRRHKTYRLLSERAVAAVSIVSVPAREAA